MARNLDCCVGVVLADSWRQRAVQLHGYHVPRLHVGGENVPVAEISLQQLVLGVNLVDLPVNAPETLAVDYLDVWVVIFQQSFPVGTLMTELLGRHARDEVAYGSVVPKVNHAVAQ